MNRRIDWRSEDNHGKSVEFWRAVLGQSPARDAQDREVHVIPERGGRTVMLTRLYCQMRLRLAIFQRGELDRKNAWR